MTQLPPLTDTSTDKAELLPCPFCRKSIAMLWDGKSDEENDEHDDSWCVVCSIHSGGCGANGGYRLDKADAIAAWNTRVPRTTP